MYLFILFFLQGSETLNLPPGDTTLQKLRRIRDEILTEKHKLESKDDKSSSVTGAIAAGAIPPHSARVRVSSNINWVSLD